MSDARLHVYMTVHEESPTLSEDLEEIVQEGLDELMEEIEWSWRQKAAMTLDTSREEYLKGISVERTGDEIQVTLDGWLPVAVETGCEPFAMKPGLLGSALFRVIPMGKPKASKGFATVSINSTGWWHPGIQARSIATQVEDEMESLFDKVFANKFTV